MRIESWACGLRFADRHGHWAGLDIDFCRALAASIFDDAGKVKFVPLTAKDRFAALQSGAVESTNQDLGLSSGPQRRSTVSAPQPHCHGYFLGGRQGERVGTVLAKCLLNSVC